MMPDTAALLLPRRTPRPAVFRPWTAAATALMLAVAAPSVAHAQSAPRSFTAADVQDALQASGKLSGQIRDFYAARNYRPLWMSGTGEPAERLIALLETANYDGLKPNDYKINALTRALERAREGEARDVAKAEALLTRSFIAYVEDIRSAKVPDIYYVDQELKPSPPPPFAILQALAAAPSPTSYLNRMPWMHPTYAGLRKALIDYGGDPQDEEAARLQLNLARARALPADMARYVIVDAATQRLTMYEGGKAAGSMKVIVGKPEMQTPIMAGLMRYAVVNPYWNVPPDLVQQRIAPNVLQKGHGYLRSAGYEVLSGWDENARLLTPEEVDWEAVAAGRKELRVRQKPGRNNMMGKVKFMFPNELGIYLHDTPDKGLFKNSTRMFSSGCVRLENAPALARWLYGKPLPVREGPEEIVPLAAPVPVYITYLTAAPAKQGVSYRKDIYGRDTAPEEKKRRPIFAGL